MNFFKSASQKPSKIFVASLIEVDRIEKLTVSEYDNSSVNSSKFETCSENNEQPDTGEHHSTTTQQAPSQTDQKGDDSNGEACAIVDYWRLREYTCL